MYSGKCLYHDGGSSLSQMGCTDDATQHWAFRPGGEIRSATGGGCVEIKGRQRLIDADLQTAACDGGWHQLRHAELRTFS